MMKSVMALKTIHLKYWKITHSATDLFSKKRRDQIGSKFDAGSIRTSIAAKINLPFLKNFGSYTEQAYNVAYLGIVIGLREYA
jgi:hypothetical protein